MDEREIYNACRPKDWCIWSNLIAPRGVDPGGHGGLGPCNILLKGPIYQPAPIRDPNSNGSGGMRKENGKEKENKRREEKWSLGPSNNHHRSAPLNLCLPKMRRAAAFSAD